RMADLTFALEQHRPRRILETLLRPDEPHQREARRPPVRERHMVDDGADGAAEEGGAYQRGVRGRVRTTASDQIRAERHFCIGRDGEEPRVWNGQRSRT